MSTNLKQKFKFMLMEAGRYGYQVISPSYRKEWRRMQHEIKKLSPKKGEVLHLLNVNEAYDQDYFSSSQFDAQDSWSDKISECIYVMYHPKSMVDFGCGPGFFLRYFYKKKVLIKGYEGSKSAFNKLVIPKKFVEQADFRNILDIQKKKYEIALSVEVAEHIEKEFAGIFLYNLTRLSDTILFTAAPPYISRKHPHHPNEQPIEYWDALFAFYGYNTDVNHTKRLQQGLQHLSLPINLKHYGTMKVYRRNLTKNETKKS